MQIGRIEHMFEHRKGLEDVKGHRIENYVEDGPETPQGRFGIATKAESLR
jgi:hypothetical protein